MSSAVGLDSVNTRFKSGTAIVTVVLLWIAFTAIQAINLDDPAGTILFFAPGLLGIMILIRAGWRREECYLRLAPLSGAGFLALTAFLPLIAPILLSGNWVGLNWVSFLVYAPASAIAQELFFRGTLLPLLLKVLKAKPLFVVFVHSLLFAAWHIPLAALTAPLAGAVAVTVVTFFGGMAWGWQVQRDRTLVWAIVQHSLFLMAMSLFEW